MERFSRSDLKAKPTKPTGKPSKSSIDRIKVLAEVTGVGVPSGDALVTLAQSVARFPDAVIDSACHALENAPQGDYRRLPTPYELVQACESASKPEVKKTRWCGRCEMGRIMGSDGEVRLCECNCPVCGNSGMTIETRKVHGMPYPTATFAVDCPRCL